MRIRVGDKEYKINKVDPRAMRFMTDEQKATWFGLPYETYQEINEAISNGVEVKVLK